MSDFDIKREIESGNISIEPFNESHLTSNGYDLSVLIEKESNSNDEFKEANKYTINSGEGVRVKSIENIHIGNGFVGTMYLRSRYSRNGLFGSFAVIDSGFNGKIIAFIKNESSQPIDIMAKNGVIHLVISRLENKSEHPYGSTKKSHFQNQK